MHYFHTLYYMLCFYALCTMYCIQCIVFYTLYDMHCILFMKLVTDRLKLITDGPRDISGKDLLSQLKNEKFKLWFLKETIFW